MNSDSGAGTADRAGLRLRIHVRESGMRTTPLILSAVILSIWIGPVTPTLGQYAGVAKHREHEQDTHRYLARFGTLDFYVLAHQNWEMLKQSHARNILVHWPDGRKSKGLDKHIEELKAVFVYAPDIRIQSQRIGFGSADWTCVIAQMKGTFTKPMPTSHGNRIPPTGKRFTITACTIAHWNKSGLMDEEYLFWDNQSLMHQIGLAK